MFEFKITIYWQLWAKNVFVYLQFVKKLIIDVLSLKKILTWNNHRIIFLSIVEIHWFKCPILSRPYHMFFSCQWFFKKHLNLIATVGKIPPSTSSLCHALTMDSAAASAMVRYQFYQHSMSSFCAQRSRTGIKRLIAWQSFLRFWDLQA